MSKPLQIDIKEIIERKSGKHIPEWTAKLLARIIHQKDINHFLATHYDKKGLDFFRAALSELDITSQWINENNLPSNGRNIFVCNHPLGAIDGMTLSIMLGERYGSVKYLVNDLLYNIAPVRSIFLPVNTMGAQKRETVQRIKDVMMGDEPVATFPAGYCSRLIDGKIQDRSWLKSFVGQAIEYKRDIVPLYFDATNSNRFYFVDKWRKRLGIKTDLSMMLLPNEMFRTRHRRFDIYVGTPISYEFLAQSNKKTQQIADEIRTICYNLKR